MSRQTVTRCELATGAYLLANAKLFFVDWFASLSTLDQAAGNVHVAGISWMDDATNSAVWQRRKLHSLKLKAMHYDPHTGDPVCLERLADILPVAGGSAYHTLALTKKAFHSLGAPFVDDAFRLPRPHAHLSTHLSFCSWW